MTARQSIANYEPKVREYANFALRGIKKICKECGPRETGGEAEYKAQQMMAAELEGCCDSVATEEFQVAPRAFMAWVKLGVILGLLSVVSYNIGYAAVSAVLMVGLLAIIVLEFLLYKQALDPFFPKKTSHNVIAVRRPKGEVKRRLIFCGHADSAPEWRFTYYGYKLFHSTALTVVVVAISLVTMLYGTAISIVSLALSHGLDGVGALSARGPALNILGYVFAGLGVSLIVGWFFSNNNRFVEGANDNLSGCFTAMALPKMLQATGTQLEHTELMVLLSGGEEAGLRGAKAFCKAHAAEFCDVETVFVALDTMTDFDFMGIYITDLTSTVKHDPAVCAMLRKAAETAGHNVPYELLPFGASDAAAATQAGLRAAAFAAMDPAPAPYYHTRLDVPDALQPKTLEACIDIVAEIAFQFDETGLAPFEGSTVKAGK
ncbi:MAG: Zn-dependent exopeptidase M28 [Oscillospiraceae bacterium]|jgi:hypothetical protein|nr:Zn-dependent exopeptidase M28 [Oscillospiraceae bacterium]